MKNTIENLIDRVNNTLAFYDLNKTTIDPFKVLELGFAKLNTLSISIKAKRPLGDMGTSEFVELRNETKQRAGDIAVACAQPLRSYAKDSNKTAILGLVPNARSSYTTGRAELLLNRLATLRTHYAEQLPNMADYAASQLLLDELDAVILEINAIMTEPTTQITNRKLVNVEISDIASEIIALYQEILIPNMEAFSILNKPLYAAWVEASRVIHTAATHLSPEEAAARDEAERLIKAAIAESKATLAKQKAEAKAARAATRAAAKAAKAAAKALKAQAAADGQKTVVPTSETVDMPEVETLENSPAINVSNGQVSPEAAMGEGAVKEEKS